MKILITGGTGFLGKVLRRALAKNSDAQVHIISSRQRKRELHEQFHTVDIRNAGEVSQVISEVRPQWIFHLAADIRRSNDPVVHREMREINVEGTRNIVNAAIDAGVTAFVMSGSFEEYGPIETPFHEENQENPVSPYGISKLTATKIVRNAGKGQLPAAVLRFPIIYGPDGHSGSFIGKIIESAREGTSVPLASQLIGREFLHVEDAARSLIHAAENIESVEGEVINVGHGEEIALTEIIALAEKILARNDLANIGAFPLREGEQLSYVGSNEKMRNVLHFIPSISIEEGLADLLYGISKERLTED
jgi:nucleoside-diphosphate-sugar epimerase